MRSRVLIIGFLFSMSVIEGAQANDAYIVRFFANGMGTECAQSVWTDNILFFNRTSVPATVTLLGVSNGTLRTDAPRELQLPPNRATALRTGPFFRTAFIWSPLGLPPLWVVHLDVPDGVTVESRDEVYAVFVCGLTDDGLPEPEVAGKVSLPIFRSLVPAGRPQVKLGTDLGYRDSRLNVAIYNAGTEQANATVEVRRACDDSLIESRHVTLPANTIAQFGGFAGTGARCVPELAALYTTVTVDQPSFSYVSNVSEAPATLGILPPIGLAVSMSTDY